MPKGPTRGDNGRRFDLARRLAKPADNVEQQKCAQEKEAGSDDVVAHLRSASQPGNVQGHDVVQNQDAEPSEVEEIAQQNGRGNHGGMRIPPEPIDIPRDQRDKAHRNGAANAVAARGDKHSELRREHEPQLVRTERLTERDRKCPRHVSGCALQREIDKHVEDVRNGVDEPEENERKQRRPEEPGTTKEQHNSCAVGEDDQRVRRDINRPLRGEDEDQNRLIAHTYDDGGDDQNDQAPPATIDLPIQRTPHPQNKHEADQRDEHTNGLEGVVCPKPPKRIHGRPDCRQPKDCDKRN